jgi:hypothetical protein
LNDGDIDDDAKNARETTANKGSDGDGCGRGSDGMLLDVLCFGIILDSFCSHTYLLISFSIQRRR